MRFGFLLVAAVLMGSVPACAAIVSGPDQTAGRGQAVIVPLILLPEGERVSAIQFDLEWHDALNVKLVAGDGLRVSSKLLFTAARGPRTVRCLIAGGDGALPEGELLKMFVIVDPQASPETYAVRVTNSVAADPHGIQLNLQPATIKIDVGGNAPTFVSLPPAGILNAASLLPGPIAPGEILTVLGGFPAEGASVFVNGLPAPILYSGPNQVNLIVPFGIDPDTVADFELRVGANVSSVPVPVVRARPAIFTQNATGLGAGAVLNEDYTVNTPANPAPRGSTVMVFGTGFGMVNPRPVDGEIVTSASPASIPVSATIRDVAAPVTYAGSAPGLIAGVNQLNLELPFTIEPTDTLELVVLVGAALSPPITIAIR